jgi:hypothetical protein
MKRWFLIRLKADFFGIGHLYPEIALELILMIQNHPRDAFSAMPDCP